MLNDSSHLLTQSIIFFYDHSPIILSIEVNETDDVLHNKGYFLSLPVGDN